MIWKTLRQQKPKKYERVLVITDGKKIINAWWCEERKCFYPSCGLVKPISNYKRWCYEHELVEQTLQEINGNIKKNIEKT